MNRNEILTTLLNDLQSITTSSSIDYTYNTDIRTTKRGVYGSDEISAFPAVCFTMERDERINNFSGDGIRMLHVYLYMYMQTKTYKTDEAAYDGIHNLVQDLEHFLYHDFSYKDDVEIGEIRVNEAGLNFPTSWAEINFTITYEYDY